MIAGFSHAPIILLTLLVWYPTTLISIVESATVFDIAFSNSHQIKLINLGNINASDAVAGPQHYNLFLGPENGLIYKWTKSNKNFMLLLESSNKMFESDEEVYETVANSQVPLGHELARFVKKCNFQCGTLHAAFTDFKGQGLRSILALYNLFYNIQTIADFMGLPRSACSSIESLDKYFTENTAKKNQFFTSEIGFPGFKQTIVYQLGAITIQEFLSEIEAHCQYLQKQMNLYADKSPEYEALRAPYAQAWKAYLELSKDLYDLTKNRASSFIGEILKIIETTQTFTPAFDLIKKIVFNIADSFSVAGILMKLFSLDKSIKCVIIFSELDHALDINKLLTEKFNIKPISEKGQIVKLSIPHYQGASIELNVLKSTLEEHTA